ncbi:MAG: prepilin-type N-terminal cleavage/methylation domain-containing protein [Candidatus Omnitrophota bacterium]|jgi:prepilin-type N-terminal cleavage/methylation domain-containing protein
MDKRSFTLLEIMISMVVMGILVTLGFPIYQGFIENSKSKVCETNLKALKSAMDIYAMEYDTMPGSLSELPPKYIGKAYARLMLQKSAWKIKLAYFMVEQEKKGFVYADTFINRLTKGNINLVTCPKDKTPPAEGGVSYGFNSQLSNMSSKDYRKLSSGFSLIADSDQPTFVSEDNYAYRHQTFGVLTSEGYAQEVVKGSANLSPAATGGTATDQPAKYSWVKRKFKRWR